MSKKLFSFVVLFFSSYAIGIFRFVDHKADGHLDEGFVQELVATFPVELFFETGTYDAGTTIVAQKYFKKVITVELHDKLFAAAQTKLSPYKHVTAVHGSSPESIKNFKKYFKNGVLFWLDAHYCGEGTALSFDNPEAPDAITAVREELAAIKALHISHCVILIDDIRGFGITVNGIDYLGCWAYPAVQEVHKALLEINPHFEIVLIGDQLLAYDKRTYKPQCSDVVKACTKTRLYDGYNLTDQQLLYYENSIRNASSEEKQFIRHLYAITAEYQDPMFWHELWYGLVELGDGNHASAQQAFLKVKTRRQYFNKNRQHEVKIIPYEHKRIDDYISACN